MNNLGTLLHAKGEVSKAEPLLREALKLKVGTLGEDHQETLVSMFSLSLLLRDSDADEAKQLCQGAVDRAKDVLGVDHPRTKTFMQNPWGFR